MLSRLEFRPGSVSQAPSARIRIEAHGPTRLVPVVILTSSREDRAMIEGYDLGANSFVQKPVEFDEFVEAVREVGVDGLLVNEPARTRPV